MHSYRFQEIEMDAAWFFWKDLGMAMLGSFKLYVMPSKITVDYYREGTITVTITEVFVYARKMFTFRAESGNEGGYLGSFNKKGVIFVDPRSESMQANFKSYYQGAAIKLAKPAGIGKHVATKENLSEDNIYWNVTKDDVAQWQDTYQQGGDFIIFSDFRRVSVREPIVVEVMPMETVEVIVSDGKLISSGSQWGHVAIDIDGTVYTRSHSKYTVLTRDRYFSGNTWRAHTGLVLKVTSSEKIIILNELKNRVALNAAYDLRTNSCSTNVADVLEMVGILAHDPRFQLSPSSTDDVSPKEVLLVVSRSKNMVRRNEYPKK
jgi:Family of unknown function (DUF6402)